MWKIEYTKRFLKELSKLPQDIQTRAERIVFEELLSANPFELGYIEQMTGYADKYKIRTGNYRIGITVDKQNNLIICQRIAHRKDIYKIFP
jgi:mRNA interferase RelE/StbE